ncbi:hypothetical protein SLS64_009690 [Diaporthe eres]|uniref:Uncharacterized protein n=1 Tax=Diaporthe eres TaxID=83184 RepID=A0ABR1NZB5_DIAER
MGVSKPFCRLHLTDKLQSSNRSGGTRLSWPKPYEDLLGFMENVTHDPDLTISLPLACVVLALVDANSVDPEEPATKPPTQTHQRFEAIRSDVKRVWSVDENSVPRLRVAPGVRQGFILDVFIEAVVVELAADGALEIMGWEELEDLYSSWVGGVERGMLEWRGSHGDH